MDTTHAQDQPGAQTATEAGTTSSGAAPARRDFLLWIAAGSLAFTGLLAGRTLVMYLMPPPRSIEGKTKIGPMPVAEMSQLKVGQPEIFEYGDDFVWITKTGPDKIVALNAACPHVACKLHWNEQLKRYDCPCHASSFSPAGKKLFGPAPRDMYPANYQIVAGKVVVSGFQKAEG